MGSFSGTCPDAVSDPVSDPGTDSLHFHLPVTSLASSGLGFDGSALGFAGSALGPHVSQEMGSPEGRVPPISSLEEPTSKPLIQYKHKGRKPKSAVGLGEQKDMDFLRRGFIKSSLSSLPLADRGVSCGGCSSQALPFSVGGPQFISPLEWSMFCSSMGFGDKGKEAEIVALLFALDVERRRLYKIEGCEL
jgi:hypothetical protein